MNSDDVDTLLMQFTSEPGRILETMFGVLLY